MLLIRCCFSRNCQQIEIRSFRDSEIFIQLYRINNLYGFNLLEDRQGNEMEIWCQHIMPLIVAVFIPCYQHFLCYPILCNIFSGHKESLKKQIDNSDAVFDRIFFPCTLSCVPDYKCHILKKSLISSTDFIKTRT